MQGNSKTPRFLAEHKQVMYMLLFLPALTFV